MGKKANIMSLSLDVDTQDKLKLFAKQRSDGNVSKLIRDLVDKFLVGDDDIIPVILKIPVGLRGKEEDLKIWLETKCTAIVKALSN